MNNMQKSMKRVFWMIALAFFLLLGSLAKLTLFDRNAIATNPYNPRLNYGDTGIQRGAIMDINGEIIAQSVLNTDETYTREYPRKRMAAHITGYSSVGKTGVEAAENFELEKIHNEIWQRIQSTVTGSEIKGNNVILTVDMRLQSVAGDLLGNKKGAIVVMQPSTGRVLTLQAYPDFDPNKVAAEWDALKEDPDSALLNRATQGLYPPGSTFKVITALGIMNKMPNWQAYTYECTGQAVFENKVIHCYNEKAHGVVDLRGALAQSCNCYFAQAAVKMGGGSLRAAADNANANQPTGFELANSISRVIVDGDSSQSELVETAIGQGRTQATPLYMAMVASAIANDGMMMRPYIVDHKEYYNGKLSRTTVPEKIRQICSPEDAQILTEMMTAVVSEGTGGAAAIAGVSVAGKTGTAENATGSDHSWFIGFAPADHPQIAVAVMIENADTGGRATPIAGKVIKAALELYGSE